MNTEEIRAAIIAALDANQTRDQLVADLVGIITADAHNRNAALINAVDGALGAWYGGSMMSCGKAMSALSVARHNLTAT